MHLALNDRLRRRNRGFTMTELMIVIAIMALILVIAIPGYQNFTRRARRSDAKLIITDTAQRLERCFAECSSYTAGTCPAPCPTLPVTSTSGHYQITTAGGSAINATTYTLVATPVSTSPQASDAECTSFTLTHLNVRTAAGTAAATCWN